MAGGNIVRMVFAGDASDLLRSMRQAGDGAEDMESSFSGASKGMIAAGAALGTAVVAGFASSLDAQDAQLKLKAQLGSTTPIAKQAGEVAGKVYAAAYGDSLDEVNEAVRAVVTSGAVAAGASNEQIESVTENVLSLSQAYDQDLQGSVNSVATMLKTGLAPSADEALDVLTKGLELGLDKGGDLLDSFSEDYPAAFKRLGLSGKDAMGLIKQGLDNGAQSADKVADAIKEFSIRAIDGSATTIDGFKSIGLNAEDMKNKIAQGGPVASAALGLTLDKLREIKDPAERARVAVELFGTQAEDLGDSLYDLDLDTAAQGLGDVAGAAQKVNDTLGEAASSKIEAAKRGFEEWKNSIIGVQGPLGDIATAVFTFGGDAIGVASQIGILAIAIKGLGGGAILSRIGAAASGLLGIGTSAETAAAGGVGRLAGVLKFAGVAAGIYIIGGAIDDANVKAAGGAENLQGQAKELHGFFQLLHGDLDFNTELTKTQTQWDQTVDNFTSGRAPIVEMFNNIGQTATNIFGAMGKAMKGDFAGAISDIKNNIVTIPGTAHPVANDIQGTFQGAFKRVGSSFADIRNQIMHRIDVSVSFNPILGAVNNAIANIRRTVTSAIPKFHDGGVMPGSSSSEGLALLKGGETVLPPGAEFTSGPPLPRMSGGGGSATVSFSGDLDSAMGSAIQKLIRSGQIQVKVR